MSNRLLDTSAYVDFQRARRYRQEPWAASTLRHLSDHLIEIGKPCLGTPTVMEIVHGLKSPDTLAVFRQQVLPVFEVVGFDEADACLAGEVYRKLEAQGLRIGITDTQLVAIAITRGLTLVTSNQKHFQRVADAGYHIPIENWREQ